MSANKLTADILAQITERFNDHVVAWRSNRIDAMAAGKNGRLRRVQAGIDGQGDITGIMPDGRRLEIEVKFGRDKMSDRQESFRRMILAHGGVYIIARDRDSCMDDLVREMLK